MIFYLHYILLTSGLSGTSVLLGVFLEAYSDASQSQIGILLMSFPFVSIVVKPLFCSMADRAQAHKSYLIWSMFMMLVGFAPFLTIPFFPAFYTGHPRVSWYILVLSCHIGLGSLGVAWSLGDTLAVNSSQRTGTPYSRMRLMGTVSWGVYGFIIGQINEIPSLPKYTPSFMILYISVLAEIILVYFWKNEDFEMYDPSQDPAKSIQQKKTIIGVEFNTMKETRDQDDRLDLDSTPGSLAGTLRLNTKTASTLRNIIAADDLARRLSNIDSLPREGQIRSRQSTLTRKPKQEDCEQGDPPISKNPQVAIFKLILSEDGRLIKYLLLFTIYGFLFAPMNFVFLSMQEVCSDGKCNFSQLAGSILISQASIETVCFLIAPWALRRLSRMTALGFGFVIIGTRYFFYANYYYTSGISPYWALIGEWGHGISYGIFATILADAALMFANQSQFFIKDLRNLGYLSPLKDNQKTAKSEAEEAAIRMALRATMQAVFSGLMDGLGVGLGSLACGLVADAYSYITLWQIFFILSASAIAFQVIVEITKCKWSDSHEPPKGSTAYNIRHANDPVTIQSANQSDIKC